MILGIWQYAYQMQEVTIVELEVLAINGYTRYYNKLSIVEIGVCRLRKRGVYYQLFPTCQSKTLGYQLKRLHPIGMGVSHGGNHYFIHPKLIGKVNKLLFHLYRRS